jgi:hypothetical protein
LAIEGIRHSRYVDGAETQLSVSRDVFLYGDRKTAWSGWIHGECVAAAAPLGIVVGSVWPGPRRGVDPGGLAERAGLSAAVGDIAVFLGR